jgi:hypothetical protein
MRSRAGYVIGGALMVAAVVGAIAWFVFSLVRVGEEVERFVRVPVPGQETVRLEARKYVVYYEGPNAEVEAPRFAVGIADARTGVPLTIAPYGGSLTYAFEGNEGAAAWTVTPPRPGRYAVRTRGPAGIDGSVAFGRSIAWPIARTIVGTFAIGGLLLAAGVGLIVLTAVRRSRASRVPPA